MERRYARCVSCAFVIVEDSLCGAQPLYLGRPVVGKFVFSLPSKFSDILIQGGPVLADAFCNIHPVFRILIAGNALQELLGPLEFLRVLASTGHGLLSCTGLSPGPGTRANRWASGFSIWISQHLYRRLRSIRIGWSGGGGRRSTAGCPLPTSSRKHKKQADWQP